MRRTIARTLLPTQVAQRVGSQEWSGSRVIGRVSGAATTIGGGGGFVTERHVKLPVTVASASGKIGIAAVVILI